jgi:hypothetical protein
LQGKILFLLEAARVGLRVTLSSRNVWRMVARLKCRKRGFGCRLFSQQNETVLVNQRKCHYFSRKRDEGGGEGIGGERRSDKCLKEIVS